MPAGRPTRPANGGRRRGWRRRCLTCRRRRWLAGIIGAIPTKLRRAVALSGWGGGTWVVRLEQFFGVVSDGLGIEVFVILDRIVVGLIAHDQTSTLAVGPASRSDPRLSEATSRSVLGRLAGLRRGNDLARPQVQVAAISSCGCRTAATGRCRGLSSTRSPSTAVGRPRSPGRQRGSCARSASVGLASAATARRPTPRSAVHGGDRRYGPQHDRPVDIANEQQFHDGRSWGGRRGTSRRLLADDSVADDQHPVSAHKHIAGCT